MKCYESVWEIVRRIPKGRVTTYGRIATAVNSLSPSTRVTPRMVGRVLHSNTDPENVPCHRVVNSRGKVAENYAFGGAREQKKKLVAEGVVFKHNLHVDLKRSSLDLFEDF